MKYLLLILLVAGCKSKPHINYRTTFLYGNDTLGYTESDGGVWLKYPSEGRKVNDSLWVFKFQEIKQTRYFFVGFIAETNEGAYCYGWHTFQAPDIPTHYNLIDSAYHWYNADKKHFATPIAKKQFQIQGFYEFPTKRDAEIFSTH